MRTRIVAGGTLATAAGAVTVLVMACGSSSSQGTGTPSGANDGGPPGDGGSIGDGGTYVGVLDGSPTTALPAAPSMSNVVVTSREDSVGIDFDPVDDAVDYRIYPLPNDSDVSVGGDGAVTIKGAVYRCAGIRQGLDVPNNTGNDIQSPDAGQVYTNGQYSWSVQTPTNPTLGYVSTTAAAGLVPVYAIGIHPSTVEAGWRESRSKIYTADASVRQTMLAAGGRDDGIVFYVPSAASASTQTIYHSEVSSVVAGQGWTQYTESYFTSADLSAHAKDTVPPAPAFQVLTASAPATEPLMAVSYMPDQRHTELAVGKERFRRAQAQGPGPTWHLEWSGITEPTVLVVEALATGCPFQGLIAPEALSAPPHQTFFTPDQAQQASASRELFVNGEYDVVPSNGGDAADAGVPFLSTTTSSPRALARAFVQVSPKPHDPAAWDWYQGFATTSSFGSVKTAADPKFATDQWSVHYTSPIFDFGAYALDKPNNVLVLSYGQMLGQFWDFFDDTGQDVTGRLRFSALTKGNVSAESYLHVTYSVTTVGTDRRYPQLLVSDQGLPVEDGMSNPTGNFVFLQTITGPSMRLETQAIHGLVNGKPWAVNNQAPHHPIIDYDNWQSQASGRSSIFPPADPPFEHAGMDRMTTYDAYISSTTMYVMMDGKPAGCLQFPTTTGFALNGPVTVTFGDVLYHEGAADEQVTSQVRPYPFLHAHQAIETGRHWDDLGFKSGAAAPTWDTANFPCAPY